MNQPNALPHNSILSEGCISPIPNSFLIAGISSISVSELSTIVLCPIPDESLDEELVKPQVLVCWLEMVSTDMFDSSVGGGV